MKHFQKALLLTIALFGIGTSLAEAETVTIDDLNYEIADEAATVTGPVDKQLTELNIPETIEYDGTTYPVTSIGDNAFSGCSYLADVTIASSVTSIGTHTFSFCPKLLEITIPQSVARIGNFVFYSCSGLETVTIADSDNELIFGGFVFDGSPVKTVYLGRNIPYVSQQPFKNLTSLAHLTIGDKVTAIGALAFQGCSSLEELTIPQSVASIGKSAFEGCTGLSKITCERMTPPAAEANSFDPATYASATLSVPDEALEAYRADPMWNKFKSIQIAVESITLDPDAYEGKEGATFQINATILPDDATIKTLEWSSSDNTIAIVDPDGKVTLQKEGYCKITARATDYSEVEATCTIDVLSSAELIEIDSNGADIEVYNLEGVLIARSLKRLPAGVYLIKQGSTVAKIRI